MHKQLEDLHALVVAGEIKSVGVAIQNALNAGFSAESILKEALIPAMDEVGELFEQGEYFVPEMLISARTMQRGMEAIRPLLIETGIQATGTVVIGTVRGDLHDIGKNLVAMMMEGAGFDVYDLGVDVSSQRFVEEALAKEADIVALSALLTTTLPSMKTTIEALASAGIRESVAVLVGGAAVNEDFALKIGADGYAADAGQAAELARRIVFERREVEKL